MQTLDATFQLIYDVLDDINMQNPPDKQLAHSPDTILFAPASLLDSLALANLIVGIEQKLEEAYGKHVDLVGEDAFSQKQSPFRNVLTLAEYITGLLQRDDHV